jgi:N utilization substance protein B
MKARRRAREHALMILYAMEVARREPDVAVERFYEFFGGKDALDPPPSYALPDELVAAYAVGEDEPELRAFATTLVDGVMRHQESLDALLQSISHNWRLERMALVDRNILRLGAFELVHLTNEVPRSAAINEAVELAKAFGAAESAAFVNGILDRIGR